MRAHVLLSVAALCAGGRRPAREIATREPSARNDRSRGPPWPCHRPPAPQPPSQRASLGTPPPDLRAARGLPARSPSTPRASLGASPRSPARPCRPRATLQSGDHDHRHRSHNPRRPHTTHQSGRRPPAPPQARTTGSQRDKTLPAQHISRSNGTKFSLLVIKRSFWPVLRMQGEFYPGYDIHGPQQGEFYPGILVAHGPHPGSAMIIHVLLAQQRP